MCRRERRVESEGAVGTMVRSAWEDGEKPWVCEGRSDEEKDEDIYLAASTVLKTTVVHFAELSHEGRRAVAAEAVTEVRGKREKKG